VGGGLAFVPRALPPDIPISRDLLLATERARAAVGELTGQARLVRNLNLIIRPLARREAVLSSRIEGTQTEIRELLLQEAEPTPPAEATDVHEVLNYLDTIELAQQWFADGRPLDKSLIKELHARLMLGVRGEDRHPGAIRASEVYIGNRALGFRGARFVPPPVEHVEPLLDNLIAFALGPDAYGALIDCALAHYQFETIHPFEDGNGRLGRLLIALQLIERRAIDRPLLYLGPYFLEHDADYRDGLLAVSTQGAWTEWIMFFLEAVRASAADARRRVERVLALRDHYQEQIIAGSNSKVPAVALELVMDRVFVSVRDVERFTHTTYPTARAAIDTLTELGILVPHGRVRGRQLWRADELLREVYES
jgi:Fic family protein